MASHAAPHTNADAPVIPRSMRVDPSRHLVPDDVPQSLLDNWQAMLDAPDAQRAALQADYEARLSSADAYARELRQIIFNAYFMRQDLDGLAYLFGKAVTDGGDDSPLCSASHVVVDCMRTIAKRLRSLDEQASIAVQKGGR